ncbi:PX domain-containing protein kinase-like protein [Montipora foliosa]|uniref:PX domain-containing protein kinase-like protein n=1 Tax=Montipora foliosa TaxID=591990 RepID=UPI0035F15FFA
MAVSPKRKGIIDDTTPLICNIEGVVKKEYVDYLMRVQRGINPDNSWQVSHRYRDFVTMHSSLETSGIELPLPPKKVFGNMDTAFIAERQQGLQNYINLVLAHPLLARHILVKRFLDPNNYLCDFQEKAMQNVAMFLRSVPNWEIVESLPDIGWRIRKQFFLIKPTDPTLKDVRNILTWTSYGQDFQMDEKDLDVILKLLTSLQHPYIYPPSFTSCNSEGVITVRNFLPNGTLRDCLCNAKPKLSQLRKYGNPKNRGALHEQHIQLFGRQILEALRFLHEKGIPYGHLHSGNVVLDGNVCRLLDIETGLLGVPPINRHRYVPMKKIQEKETQDVYCFAHLLYEMLCGEPLRSSFLKDVPQNCPSQLKSILLSILSDEACNKSGLPTVADLLANPFFTAIDLPSIDKPQLKIPSKLKEVVKATKERSEARLKEDQKLLRHFRRASKAHAYHMSEEEKKKRKKSVKKLQKEASLTDPSQTSAPPASPLPATRNHAPVPPPPKSPAPPPSSSQASAKKTPSAPKTEGRGALLSSICDFKKGALKKTETNDKSKPKI